MKNYLIILCVTLTTLGTFAQTKDRKNNISVGGGRESYNGDLGNYWFKYKEEWYGFVKLSYSRYLNKSFDGMIFASVGDLGHCRESDDPVTVLNYYSRMKSAIVALKYKFANGYILKEDSKILPYIFLGGGVNNLTDIWNHKDVNPGNYTSINGGLGVTYNFTERFNLSYNLGFGYFTSDALDYIVKGSNDKYMQNTFLMGFNF